jgi:pyruvate formate lyase activating enzyme
LRQVNLNTMFEARFYTVNNERIVTCNLCPHRCKISEGKTGLCKVRRNFQGKLIADNYGKLTSLRSDPIEKKPLYHFYPGTKILSAGSWGCNFKCSFCQNWSISQEVPEIIRDEKNQVTTPQALVKKASEIPHNTGIAYTYNEPVVWYEYMVDTAQLAKAANLRNVMVSNGYINQEPLQELLPFIDAFNIDLKGFSENFYKTVAHGKLQPVLDTLKTIRDSGKHLEITNLIIPETNDDIELFEEMLTWIYENLGHETILHLSRYFPDYYFLFEPTPLVTMTAMYNLASRYLLYVYPGNIEIGKTANSYCPSCGHLLVQRHGYQIAVTGIKDHSCGQCGLKVPFIM